MDGILTPEERITWRRIKSEPESLLEDETEDKLKEYADSGEICMIEIVGIGRNMKINLQWCS